MHYSRSKFWSQLFGVVLDSMSKILIASCTCTLIMKTLATLFLWVIRDNRAYSLVKGLMMSDMVLLGMEVRFRSRDPYDFFTYTLSLQEGPLVEYQNTSFYRKGRLSIL